MKKSVPLALVNKYRIDRCRECGEPIKEGTQVWWMKETGSAHLTCGWTTKNGKVHPVTKPAIEDIPAGRSIVKAKDPGATEAPTTPVFGKKESFMGKRYG